MPLTTLTTKGQVTIPKDIRDSLKLRIGDKIEFIITKKGEAIIRAVTKKVDEVFGKLEQNNGKIVSVEEMNSAIKNRMKEKYK